MRGLILTFILLGCLSPRKADKQLSNLNDKYPAKVAKLCSGDYPCFIVKSDTTYIDTIVCDSVFLVDTIISLSNDTIIKNKVVIKRVPIRLPQIIKYYEDSSKIKILNDEWQRKLNEVKRKQNNGGGSMLLILFLLLMLYLALKKKK